MPKIKVLSGGGFPEREVNSQTVRSLRNELDMAAGSTVAVNGTGVTDDYVLQDGDIVAAVTSNKTGGHDVDVYLYRDGTAKILENWDLESILTDVAVKSAKEIVM